MMKNENLSSRTESDVTKRKKYIGGERVERRDATVNIAK